MSQLKLTADGGGGTVSLKGPSSTTGNAAIELTVPGTGNATLLTSATSTGKILQHQIVSKTDTTSTTSSTVAEISSDFRITITPTASNTIIVCHAELIFGDSAGYTHAIRIVKNTASDFSGTTSDFMTPDSYNNNTDGHVAHYDAGGGISPIAARAFETSGNTTARTYSIQWSTSGGTLYLNRYTSSNYQCVSTFSVMEVAA